jgi:hypothetical protein
MTRTNRDSDSIGSNLRAAVSAIIITIIRFGGFLFDLHIPKLVRIEDLATFHAFNILHVFLAGDDTDLRVFAGARHFECLDRSFQEVFAPDCTEPWLFLKGGFRKDLWSLSYAARKSSVVPYESIARYSFKPIELAVEMVVH